MSGVYNMNNNLLYTRSTVLLWELIQNYGCNCMKYNKSFSYASELL